MKCAVQLLACTVGNFSFARGLDREVNRFRRQMHPERRIDELKCLAIHHPEFCAQRLMTMNNLVNGILKRGNIKHPLDP